MNRMVGYLLDHPSESILDVIGKVAPSSSDFAQHYSARVANLAAISGPVAVLEERRARSPTMPQILPEGVDLLARLAAASDLASARLLLISLASALLLNAGQITAPIDADHRLRDALTRALDALPADDALRMHFLRVQNHQLEPSRQQAVELPSAMVRDQQPPPWNIGSSDP